MLLLNTLFTHLKLLSCDQTKKTIWLKVVAIFDAFFFNAHLCKVLANVSQGTVC